MTISQLHWSWPLWPDGISLCLLQCPDLTSSRPFPARSLVKSWGSVQIWGFGPPSPVLPVVAPFYFNVPDGHQVDLPTPITSLTLVVGLPGTVPACIMHAHTHFTARTTLTCDSVDPKFSEYSGAFRLSSTSAETARCPWVAFAAAAIHLHNTELLGKCSSASVCTNTSQLECRSASLRLRKRPILD
jgi:hypothetical protein